MNASFLCAEITATDARFGLVNQTDGRYRVTASTHLSTPASVNIEALIQAAQKTLETETAVIILTLPASIKDQCCQATWLPWPVSAAQIQSSIGLPCHLIHRQEAMGWGLPLVKDEQCIPLGPTLAIQPGNRCLLNVSTDLSETVLYWNGHHHHPFATAGEHTDFAPQDDTEIQILELLMDQYGQATWGDVISGRGLAMLNRWLSDDPACCISGEDICDRAEQGDTAAQIVTTRLLSLLGREAANLALKSMSMGGVYLTGDILSRLPQELVQRTLYPAFINKPGSADLLAQIPLYWVDEPDLALIGAAHWARVQGIEQE